jgi:hypothetical protein
MAAMNLFCLVLFEHKEENKKENFAFLVSPLSLDFNLAHVLFSICL